MHIAYLSSEYPSQTKPEGGLGNYIRKVSRALIERGHKVSVFILDSKSEDKNDQGVQLHYVKQMRFHWRIHSIRKLHPWLVLIEDRVNAKRLKKKTLKHHRIEKIDILQTPNYKAPGLDLCHNGFFPVVCRCSSYQPLLRSANGKLKHLPDVMLDYFEARQLTQADAAFSPSELIANTYERFEGVKPEVIRTPIAIDTINDDESIYQKHLKGVKYLLYFGALNGVKGVDLLIKAIPAILEKNEEAHFVLIGRNDPLPEGEKAYDVIQKELHDFLTEKRVLYYPSMTKTQLFPIIGHALGVVLPSRVDNYPNACLEALSFGIPVIGTYGSSLDEIITDKETGFLAQNNNVESLVSVINNFFDMSESELNLMKENVEQLINEIQNEDRVLNLLNFYASVTKTYNKKEC